MPAKEKRRIIKCLKEIVQRLERGDVPLEEA